MGKTLSRCLPSQVRPRTEISNLIDEDKSFQSLPKKSIDSNNTLTARDSEVNEPQTVIKNPKYKNPASVASHGRAKNHTISHCLFFKLAQYLQTRPNLRTFSEKFRKLS